MNAILGRPHTPHIELGEILSHISKYSPCQHVLTKSCVYLVNFCFTEPRSLLCGEKYFHSNSLSSPLGQPDLAISVRCRPVYISFQVFILDLRGWWFLNFKIIITCPDQSWQTLSLAWQWFSGPAEGARLRCHYSAINDG